MILKYPNKILRQPAEVVTAFDANLKKLADELLNTVVPDPLEPASPSQGGPLGVGLAANQIGKLWRIFVMMMPASTRSRSSTRGGPNNKLEVIINPQILKTTSKMLSSLPKNDQFLEGCLSFPGWYGFVDRPIKIKVAYQTLSGLTKTARLAAPYSAYFQHERDHLDGILFIDYLKKSKEQLYFGPGRDSLKPVTNPFLTYKVRP
ncbi:peptide deformylase [Microgenomates group bacterium]|nr:peptide deformylase [Microgenomates group bacterium]